MGWPERVGNGVGQCLVSRSPKDQPASSGRFADQPCRFRKALRRPAFGRAILGPRIQSQPFAIVLWRLGELEEEVTSLRGFDLQMRRKRLRLGTQRGGQVQVVKQVMARSGVCLSLRCWIRLPLAHLLDAAFAHGGTAGLCRHHVSQEETPPTSLYPNAPGDASQTHFQRGAGRIGQDQRRVEAALAKLQGEAGQAGGPGHGEDFIDGGMMQPEACQLLRRQQGDVRLGMGLTQALKGRRGHDRIAEPVDPSHDDALRRGSHDLKPFLKGGEHFRVAHIDPAALDFQARQSAMGSHHRSECISQLILAARRLLQLGGVFE